MSWATQITPNKVAFFLDRLRTEHPTPPHIDWDPSSRCDHRCPGCFYIMTDEQNRDMSMDGFVRPEMAADRRAFFDFQRAVRLSEEIRECGGRAVTFVGGGEPTLHPRFADIATAVADRGLKFGLISHFGLPYRESFFEPLLRATWVRVSSNAARAETYAEVQGCKPEVFDRVLRNVARLRALRGEATHPRIGMSFLVSRANHREIVDVVPLARAAGFDLVQFKPIILAEHERAYEGILPEVLSSLRAAQDLAAPGFQVLQQFEDRLAQLRQIWNVGYSGRCHVPWWNPKVAANGDLSVCCETAYAGPESPYTLGSLYESSLRELLDRVPGAMAGIDMRGCPVCWERDLNVLINEGRAAEIPAPPRTADAEFV